MRAPSRHAGARAWALFAGLGEPLSCIHANCLEQPVAPFPASLLDGDERLLGEARQDVRDLGRIEPVAGADLLDGLELEAAREDRKPAEQDLLVGLEQIVAPLQRRGQRLLPGRCGVAARSQQTEAVVEPLGDRRRAEHADTSRGELECERQPVEAEADARHVLRVLRVEREARRGGRRTVDEERDGLVFAELLQRERLIGTRECRATGRERRPRPATRSGSRLVATIVSCGREAKQPVGQRGRRRQHVLAVVEHEQQRSRRENVDHRIDEVLSRQRANVERSRDRLRDQPCVRERGQLDERRPRLVRRLGASGELEREPRLAGAAGPGQGEEARAPEQRLQLGRAPALGR